MKIRNGFVANSSSTSFCIYGVCLEMKGKYKKSLIDYIFENNSENISREELEDYFIYDLLDYLRYSTPLELEGYEYNEYSYIGKSWTEIKDNETSKEFKDKIKEKIQMIFPDIEDKEFGTFEESWYDG